MKSILLVAIGVTALISGCAFNPNAAAVDDGIDYQKVATINNVAKSRGVMVQWLNYPQRRSAPIDVVPSLGQPTGT